MHIKKTTFAFVTLTVAATLSAPAICPPESTERSPCNQQVSLSMMPDQAAPEKLQVVSDPDRIVAYVTASKKTCCVVKGYQEKVEKKFDTKFVKIIEFEDSQSLAKYVEQIPAHDGDIKATKGKECGGTMPQCDSSCKKVGEKLYRQDTSVKYKQCVDSSDAESICYQSMGTVCHRKYFEKADCTSELTDYATDIKEFHCD